MLFCFIFCDIVRFYWTFIIYWYCLLCLVFFFVEKFSEWRMNIMRYIDSIHLEASTACKNFFQINFRWFFRSKCFNKLEFKFLLGADNSMSKNNLVFYLHQTTKILRCCWMKELELHVSLICTSHFTYVLQFEFKMYYLWWIFKELKLNIMCHINSNKSEILGGGGRSNCKQKHTNKYQIHINFY